MDMDMEEENLDEDTMIGSQLQGRMIDSNLMEEGEEGKPDGLSRNEKRDIITSGDTTIFDPSPP